MNPAILLAFVLFVFLPRPALAYIDPASGSIIISAIISAIVAVSVAVRTYWAKIKKALKGDSSTDETEKITGDET